MYDTPGSDSGREWIEVQNTGPSVVDLHTYRLVESGTNHALTPVSGGSTLAAGAVAVIARDPLKFAAEWPSYSGIIFKSSFSLSNTGEALALKVGTSTAALDDSATFSSSMGAGGNGLSLHRVENSFVATDPDPGVVAPYYVAKSIPKAVVAQGTSAPAPMRSAPASRVSKGNTGSTRQRVAEQPVISVDARTSGDEGESAFPLWAIVASLAGLVVLGGVGAVYALHGTLARSVSGGAEKSGTETFPSVDEFDIQ